MKDEPRRYNQKIDPMDPSFSQPRESKRLSKIYKDCDFYRVPTIKNRKGYKTVCVYHGMYYRSKQNKYEKKKYRIKYAISFVIIFLTYLCCCIMPSDCNKIWFVGISEMISLLAFSYVAVTFIIYLTAEQKMKEYMYKMTSLKLIVSTGVTAVTLVVCAITTILGLTIYSSGRLWLDLLGVLGLIVSSVGMFRLKKIEEGVPYKKWLSDEAISKVDGY